MFLLKNLPPHPWLCIDIGISKYIIFKIKIFSNFEEKELTDRAFINIKKMKNQYQKLFFLNFIKLILSHFQ